MLTRAVLLSALVILIVIIPKNIDAEEVTVASLQAQINALMAQLSALQGGSATGTAVQYNTNLTVGSTGADVTELQQMLVAKGFLQMPAGVSYGYFGPLTKAAVAKWQRAFGISPAVGYFGPISRAKANSINKALISSQINTSSDQSSPHLLSIASYPVSSGSTSSGSSPSSNSVSGAFGSGSSVVQTPSINEPPIVTTPPVVSLPVSNNSFANNPRTYIDTAMPTLSGRVIRVSSGDNLQSAINSATNGDVIELEAGATFSGPFTLPAKSGSGWIVIRSSLYNQMREGVRVNPSQVSLMPKLVGGISNSRTLKTDNGASHWRIVGVEMSLENHNLPALVNSIVELANGSDNIILDRVYVHGLSSQNLQRCIIMNNASSAVINSWLDDCHTKGSDSQAIIGWNGPGPFKIVNNYLAGAGENIMFGGASIGNGSLPSDIEIRQNYIYKPLSWRGVWTVKNSFEIKMAERVLFEGNVIENNWEDAQVGFALNIKSENLDIKTKPNISTNDIIIKNNNVINSRFGVTIIGTASSLDKTGTGKTSRIVLENNKLDVLDRGLQVSDIENLEVSHNTIPARVNIEGPISNLVFRDNIVVGPVKGSGLTEGTITLETYAPNAVFTGNSLVGARANYYPSGNFFPVNLISVNNISGIDIVGLSQAIDGVKP